jgi:transcriptional regulator with XRE-family HTH domain
MSIVFTKLDETSSTKSDTIFYMANAPKEFIDWLNIEIKKRNLGIRETASKVGVSHPTNSDIVTNGKKPSLDTVLKLAKAFEKSPVFLARLAGLIPPEPEYIPLLDEWNSVFYELTPEDQQEILEIARMKANKHKAPIKITSRRITPARTALKEK